jgi:hypothetical protein
MSNYFLDQIFQVSKDKKVFFLAKRGEQNLKQLLDNKLLFLLNVTHTIPLSLENKCIPCGDQINLRSTEPHTYIKESIFQDFFELVSVLQTRVVFKYKNIFFNLLREKSSKHVASIVMDYSVIVKELNLNNIDELPMKLFSKKPPPVLWESSTFAKLENSLPDVSKFEKKLSQEEFINNAAEIYNFCATGEYLYTYRGLHKVAKTYLDPNEIQSNLKLVWEYTPDQEMIQPDLPFSTNRFPESQSK